MGSKCEVKIEDGCARKKCLQISNGMREFARVSNNTEICVEISTVCRAGQIWGTKMISHMERMEYYKTIIK